MKKDGTSTTFEFNVLMPMKDHSARVPGKNLRAFCGKPLYRHLVERLLDSPYVAGVYIDTDSPGIVEDVRKTFPQKVNIIPRPKALCGDDAPFNDILKYDLSQIEGEGFLQVHSTSPLLTTDTINNAIERFVERGDHDSLFGVNKHQVRFYDREGKPVNHDPKDLLLRTQDLEPLFEEASNIYIFTREGFLKCGRRIGDRPLLFEVPKFECIDIDTEADFQLAEKMYRAL